MDPASSPGGGDARHSHPARSPTDKRRRDNLSPEERSRIGQMGGEAVSRNREHMAAIGRKGGESRGAHAPDVDVGKA